VVQSNYVLFFYINEFLLQMATKIYSSVVYMYLHYIYAFYLQTTVLVSCTISSNIKTLCALTTHSIRVLHINSDQTACIYLTSNNQTVFVMGICCVLRCSGILRSVRRQSGTVFRDGFIATIVKGQAEQFVWECLTLVVMNCWNTEDGTDRLSRNVGK
jgi:hypothetical protein